MRMKIKYTQKKKKEISLDIPDPTFSIAGLPSRYGKGARCLITESGSITFKEEVSMKGKINILPRLWGPNQDGVVNPVSNVLS
jgi:hypothetical protein